MGRLPGGMVGWDSSLGGWRGGVSRRAVGVGRLPKRIVGGVGKVPKRIVGRIRRVPGHIE